MNTHPVLFYDGVCALCNKAVRFFLRYDKKQRYRYAALQSAIAGQMLGESSDLKTVVLYMNGKSYRQSEAAIRAVAGLGGWWSSLRVLLLIPAPIRNWLYNVVASNRYKWFGKYESCPLPSPDKRHLFIDN